MSRCPIPSKLFPEDGVTRAPCALAPDALNGGTTLLAVVVFALSRLWLVLLAPPLISDVPLYCSYAIRSVDLGQVPYADFHIEYPPIAYWILALPRILDRMPYPHAVFEPNLPADLLQRYTLGFRCVMCLFDGAAFLCFLHIVRRRKPEVLTWAALGYALAGLLLAPVLYDRLDAGLLFLVLAWLYAMIRSLERPTGSLGWDLVACLALGLSIGYKWVPLVAVPYYLFGIWRGGPSWGRALSAAGVVALASLLAFLVHFPSAGNGVWWFLDFHKQRGLEVECLYASVLLALQPLGFEVHGTPGPGSLDIAGPWSSRLASMSTVLLLVLFAGFALWAWRRRPEFNRLAGYRLAVFILLLTVTFAKVLSPQYFVWLIPLLLLLGLELLDQRGFLVLVLLTLVLAGLTTWIFPFHFVQARDLESGAILNPLALVQGFGKQRAFHPLTSAILGLRNGLLLGLLAWLGLRLLYAGIRRTSRQRTTFARPLVTMGSPW